MIPSERLKALHELAEQTRRREQALKPPIEELRASIERIHTLVMRHRLREIREWSMTDAELAELRALEREAELDQADERNNDWSR